MTDPSQSGLSVGGRIDALCDRFESDWRSKRRPQIEGFLEQVEQSHQSFLLGELLFLELEYRQRYNERPTLQEYRERFAPYDEIVAKVFADFVGWSSARIRKLKTSSIRDGRISRGARRSGDEEGEPVEDDFRFPGGNRVPRVLGNYVLLDLIGKGAMGVVYRALQRNIGRIVAIKLIRPDILSDLTNEQRAELIERFRTETLAAARLDHEHIVTVYEVGEVDGYHYYSMQYVEGQSLAELCSDGPLENRRAAELLASVARGLHEAHACNILHRDLKPKNILVDFNTGRTLIADFGLAKLQESGRSMTTTGDMIGSPAYMAPEQAMDSARVTAAADVYGVGATLYHALTAKPPFQSAAVVMTIGQVIFDDPVPPRRLNPSVDRDLETICLKCLEKDPERRYASAGELADDLDRYVNGEPIRARPIGPFGRILRWCRRKPMVAALAAVAATLLIAVIAVAAAAYVNTSAALQREETERARADSQLDKAVLAESREKQQRLVAQDRERVAHRNLAMALQLVDRFQNQLAEDPRLKAHDLELLRRELLDSARDFYDNVDSDAQGSGGVDVRDRRGRAYGQLAALTAELGLTRDAITLYQIALGVFKDLRDAHPDSPLYQNQYAQHLASLGALYCNIGQLADAQCAHQEAYEICRQLVRAHPDAAQYGANLAQTHQKMAILHQKMGLVEVSQRDWQAAIDIWLRVLIGDSANAEYLHGLAECHDSLANLFRESSRYPEAETEFRDALKIWEQLARDNPLIPEYRRALANCRCGLAMLHGRLDQLADAETEHGAALAIRARLASEHPNVPLYQSELAASHMELGGLYEDTRRLEPAEAAYREAVRICETLADSHKDVTEYKADLAASLCKLGTLLANDGRDDAAMESFLKATANLESLASRNTEVPRYRAQLVDAYKSLGHVLRRQRELDDAESAFKAAVQFQQQLEQDYPNEGDRKDVLAASRIGLGAVYVDQGDLAASQRKPKAALQRYTAAADVMMPLADSLDHQKDARSTLNKALAGRAQACDQLEQYADAVASWDRAIGLETGDTRDLLRLRRAVSLARKGDHRGAIRDVEALANAAAGKPNHLYHAARVYSFASAEAAEDKLLGDNRTQLVEKLSAKAVGLLEQAFQAGYFRTAESISQLVGDGDFAAIRGRDDFQQLIRRAAAPSPGG